MPIQALTVGTAAKLRSAEVITDSVSAIKELIDNALDAGASNIIVTVSTNLHDSIKVTDNGAGIPPRDRPYIGKRNHTSKIRSIEDLDSLGGTSLGFRGEALASIAKLGANGLTVTTRTKGEPTAVKLNIGCNGNLVQKETAASGIGTVVLVQDFLKAIPVRRMVALKKSSKDSTRLKNLVRSYALARPAVRLQLKILGAKEKDADLDYTPPRHDPPSLMAATIALFGRAVSKCCIAVRFPIDQVEVNSQSGTFVLDCVLPDPATKLDSGSTSMSCGQYVAIDSRPISVMRGIGKNVVKKFRECLDVASPQIPGTSFVAINIACPSNSYDVNIEPAKDDVVFIDPIKLLVSIEAAMHHVYAAVEPRAEVDLQDDRAMHAAPINVPGDSVSVSDRTLSDQIGKDLGRSARSSSHRASDFESSSDFGAENRELANMQRAVRHIPSDESLSQNKDNAGQTAAPVLREPGERLPPVITNPWTLAQLQKKVNWRQAIPESSDPLLPVSAQEEQSRFPPTPVSHSKAACQNADRFDLLPPLSPPQKTILERRELSPEPMDSVSNVGGFPGSPRIQRHMALQFRRPPRQRQLKFTAAPKPARELSTDQADSGQIVPLDNWLASQQTVPPDIYQKSAKHESSPGIRLEDIPDRRQMQRPMRQGGALTSFDPSTGPTDNIALTLHDMTDRHESPAARRQTDPGAPFRPVIRRSVDAEPDRQQIRTQEQRARRVTAFRPGHPTGQLQRQLPVQYQHVARDSQPAVELESNHVTSELAAHTVTTDRPLDYQQEVLRPAEPIVNDEPPQRRKSLPPNEHLLFREESSCHRLVYKSSETTAAVISSAGPVLRQQEDQAIDDRVDTTKSLVCSARTDEALAR